MLSTEAILSREQAAMKDLQLQIFTLLPAIFFFFVDNLLQQRRLQPDRPWVQQQEKSTVTLPPFWDSMLAACFAFAEIKFHEKVVDVQARKLDLLLTALPEKVQDQVMDVTYDTLKAYWRPTFCRSRRRWMSCSRWSR
jgi:hypothetical protein